jgi:glycosyltransferase involved in cell wall biosynthesis/predicted HAD superfamily hydrolase/Tfp pilus assembly protein PilF
MNDDSFPLFDLPADLWRREESLCRADEIISQSEGTIIAVSFDFFDTMVWRLVNEPTKVFCELHLRLQSQGLLRRPFSPQEFEVLRRHAEIKTREHQAMKDNTREDISVIDIYTRMSPVVTNTEAAMEIEYQAERDLCVLNPFVASFAMHQRRQGRKLMIVSDIYLSAAQLGGILRVNKVGPAWFDVLVTSCDEGVCKGTGNLFKRALKKGGLAPGQVLHLGDNMTADVTGARKAGVRSCHYTQVSPRTRTILERERILLGGQSPVFGAHSLRTMAARSQPNDSEETFFDQMGALLMGPLLTRYAAWACEQWVAGGVRKVGALMREGELFGQVLQEEAKARGYDLEVIPLYINRKATDLAAINRLTADNLIAWLEARPTLSVKTILSHFGLSGSVVAHLPLNMEDKADKPEKILQLAKFLFTPDIARRIEARSAEERQKIIDYLRPWLESGHPIGLGDIGYSASAQTQLKRCFEIEDVKTHMIGCYLVGCERVADRVLDGVDIRTFLGEYGHPDFFFHAFVRSPAFMEQSLVAAMGTTLGYERLADGSVKPILDRIPYDDTMIQRQKRFKKGVLEFQRLWLWTSRLRPGLIDGSTDLSKRILADVDLGFSPILARATAFPLSSEVARFGSLALDDYYFADNYMPLCGEKDAEKLRTEGLAQIMAEPGVLWPHGVFHKENPRTAREFFSCAKAMLYCNVKPDTDGIQSDITVIVSAGSRPAALRECLSRLRNTACQTLRLEAVILTAQGQKDVASAALECARPNLSVHIYERGPNQSLQQQINQVADDSEASCLLYLDEGVLLPSGWDAPLLDILKPGSEAAAAVPATRRLREAADNPVEVLRCFLIKRRSFIEGLGLSDELSLTASIWKLADQLQAMHQPVQLCSEVTVELKHGESCVRLTGSDRSYLAQRCPAYPQLARMLCRENAGAATQAAQPAQVDWVGSFLDYGSLSQVNRELTSALRALPGVTLRCVNNGAAPAKGRSFKGVEVSAQPSPNASVTIRHGWPPDWKPVSKGSLVVIQPWEYGSLPAEWVEKSRGVHQFWVPSEYVRKVYVESGIPAAKVKVVPNGIDPARFNPQAAPFPLPTRKSFKFLFVGGTIHRKGPDVLLQAFVNAFKAQDDVCLVIKDFGGKSFYAGQTMEDAVRLAQAQPNVPEIVYLNEELAPESLPGLYTACDCLVHPYRGEGFGLPILEAMACGLPVIVTSGGAADDFARSDLVYPVPASVRTLGRRLGDFELVKDGWLLEPSLQETAARMRYVFEHREEARSRGSAAGDYVRQNWTWAAAAQQISLHLQSLLAQPAAVQVAVPSPAPDSAAAKPAPITVPPCGLLGHLGDARAALGRKDYTKAWKACLTAVELRPFHPEAALLMAEIALAAGDGDTARLCAHQAAIMAPGWKQAKKFLKGNLRGKLHPDWLVLPEGWRKDAQAAPRLSVCLIAKNEENFLPQCLKSVRSLASQIVVVDTGSTDRTVEIAREHGAEVHHFKWCDDFAAARNAALEHARGDWVLMLDADEELTAENHAALKKHLGESNVIAWRLPLVDIGREKDGCSYVPRLFRNAPALFYVSRVHEQVFSSIEVRREQWGMENRLGKATLLHHGYRPEIIQERGKIERNLRLLELAVKELPGESSLLMNYGLELTRSGQAEAGLVQYRLAFEAMASLPPAHVVPEMREMLLTQFASQLLSAGQLEELVRTLTSPLAASKPGLTASLHFSLGLALMRLNRFDEAAGNFQACLDKRHLPALAPIVGEITKAGPRHCLALCLSQLNRKEDAAAAFVQALKDYPESRPLRMDYAQFLAAENRPVDALQQLHALAIERPADVLAWRLGAQISLRQPEFLEVACDWTKEARQHHPNDPVLASAEAEAQLLSGKISEAQRIWNEMRTDGAPDSRQEAASIICALLSGSPAQASGGSEAAVSREFLRWYQKLLQYGAHETIGLLNQSCAQLAKVLPTAAAMLEAAIREAGPEPANSLAARA